MASTQPIQVTTANPTKTMPTESAESRLLVSHAFELARALGIGKLLVYADELRDRQSIDNYRQGEVIVWLSRGPDDGSWSPGKSDMRVQLPDAELDRMDQINMGLLFAVMSDFVGPDESIICLTGLAGSQRLDNLLITNPRRDTQWFRRQRFKSTDGKSEMLASRSFGRLIELALRFAKEGREGKPIGTILVLGDVKELEPYLKQLIINPCRGHSKKLRNIYNPDFIESMRELAALDGAFIITRGGVVERAAVYIDAPLSRRIKLRPGLGARHAAGAALSDRAECVVIVISESSGKVTVFHKGTPILELERPSLFPAVPKTEEE